MNVPDRLVEKAAQAVGAHFRDESTRGWDEAVARAVLETVLYDIRIQVGDEIADELERWGRLNYQPKSYRRGSPTFLGRYLHAAALARQVVRDV